MIELLKSYVRIKAPHSKTVNIARIEKCQIEVLISAAHIILTKLDNKGHI